MRDTPGLAAIFAAFFRLGLTAFGGPAMLPAMRRRVVNGLGWMTEGEFKAGVALTQVIPGASMMQMAAYVGLNLRGVPGAAAAFAGFSLPAFAIMTAFAAFYARTADISALAGLFAGLKILVAAICLVSGIDFLRRFTGHWVQRAVAGGAGVLFFIGIKPFSLLLGAAILGVLLMKDESRPECPAKPAAYGWRFPVLLFASYAGFIAAMFLADPLLGRLALSMGKVDLQAFGGFGAFPVMFAEVVRARHWLDEKSFMDAMAMAQVTPGPFLVASAFVGYHLKGIAGALTGWIGVFAPSFLLLLAAAPARDAVLRWEWARNAVAGIMAALGGMIVAVGAVFARSVDWGWPQGALLALAVIALARRIDTLWVVLGGTAVSALLF